MKIGLFTRLPLRYFHCFWLSKHKQVFVTLHRILMLTVKARSRHAYLVLDHGYAHIRLTFFTDTAAILNLLDLGSLMGCSGGTRSVFSRGFRAKKKLHCIFLVPKAIIITSKHGTTIFFSHYNIFLGKLKEELARKARLYILREYIWSCSCPPGHLIILPKSNKFNMAAVSVIRSIATTKKDTLGFVLVNLAGQIFVYNNNNNNNNNNSLLKLSCSKKTELSSTFYNHKATII